jgi:hypothetical protein
MNSISISSVPTPRRCSQQGEKKVEVLELVVELGPDQSQVKETTNSQC